MERTLKARLLFWIKDDHIALWCPLNPHRLPCTFPIAITARFFLRLGRSSPITIPSQVIRLCFLSPHPPSLRLVSGLPHLKPPPFGQRDFSLLSREEVLAPPSRLSQQPFLGFPLPAAILSVPYQPRFYLHSDVSEVRREIGNFFPRPRTEIACRVARKTLRRLPNRSSKDSEDHVPDTVFHSLEP